MTDQYVSCADTAKLIRKDLAAYFPGVKFSVRSKTYSGGASITVDYVDGPASKDVERIVDRYEGATFDGMIDLKSYVTHECNGQRVHFGADYIFVEHDWTPGQRAAIEAMLPLSGTTGRPMDRSDYSYWSWFQTEATEYARREWPEPTITEGPTVHHKS